MEGKVQRVWEGSDWRMEERVWEGLDWKTEGKGLEGAIRSRLV